MSKSANPGELRTPIVIQAPAPTEDADGYDGTDHVNVCMTKVKWISAFGSEFVAAQQLGLKDPAIITMRYRANISAKCRVIKDGDYTSPYQIDGINDVNDAKRWLEIRVSRAVSTV